MYNITPTPRQIAISKNQTRYISTPCIHGHTGERFVRNNSCVQCHRIANKAGKKAQQRRRRERDQANKPAKTLKTDFEKWIKRSKSNRRVSSTREALSMDYYKTLYSTHCPLLGIELFYGTYIGAIPKNYASLDKIDPQKGYVEGNVQIISFRANTIKNSATLEEMKKIVSSWEKRYIHTLYV